MMFRLRDAHSPIEILDRMRGIVASEQIVHGAYVEPDARNEERSDALCGGYYFCAVGSLWFAAGAPILDGFGSSVYMPGVRKSERDETVLPHLAEARAALNAVAQELIDSGKYGQRTKLYGDNPDPLEELFEDYYMTGEELLKVIDEARARLA